MLGWNARAPGEKKNFIRHLPAHQPHILRRPGERAEKQIPPTQAGEALADGPDSIDACHIQSVVGLV